MRELTMLLDGSFLGIGSILNIWNWIWPYLLMVGGFSAIVFVHELGHFAVAKWAGVRVEKFAIGFGRELFGFTRGETRYSFNFLPLGGYVKMLGQEDFDDKSEELKFNDNPRSFVNKPVAHRMAIVSAGVVMNVLFAGLLFMIVFLVGIEVPSPRIGYVEPDSPAAKAGLLPGDLICKINNDEVMDFKEVFTAIFLSKPHEPIKFEVQRNGELTAPILVKPEYRQPEFTRQMQRQIVGIQSGVTRTIAGLGPEIDANRADHPHLGDVIVEVDGMPVTEENISRVADLFGYTERPIVVDRKDPKNPSAPASRVEVRISPTLQLYPSDTSDPASTSVLGLTPLVRFSVLDPKGRAYLAGIGVGDSILRWDDIALPNSFQVATAIRENPERDIPFIVMKPDGRMVDGAVRPQRNKRGPATVQALFRRIDAPLPASPQTRVDRVRPGGIADRAGLRADDLVTAVGGVTNPTSSVVIRTIRENRDKGVSLTVRRAGVDINLTLIPMAPGSIDAMHNLLADDLLVTGPVVERVWGEPTPAAIAGVPAGARITEVNGKPVNRWRDLIQAFREHAGGTVELAYLGPDKHKKVVAFAVPHSLRTLLGIGPEGRILRIDGKESVAAPRSTEGEEISVRYHEGERTILSQLVGRLATVEFRAHSFAPVETRSVMIASDMVDPWLARVAFAPSIRLDEERKVLKGENAADAVWIGVHKTYYFIVQVYQVMHRMIFSRSVSAEAMSGPLGIMTIGGQIAQSGWMDFLFFLAMISANLAVVNFLPLPIVDGGLMIFLIIEKIKGSPVSLKVQIATQSIGIVLIIGAFLYVTYNDAVRIWG